MPIASPVRFRRVAGNPRARRPGTRRHLECVALEARHLLSAPSLFAQVLDPTGLATDDAGDVFVAAIENTPNGTSSVIAEFAPDGTRKGGVTVSTGVVAFPGNLLPLGPSAPTLSSSLADGDVLVLMPGGQILDYRPSASSLTPFFNLTSIRNPDVSSVFDAATGLTGDFSGQIAPQLADYGDIAVLGQQVLVTGRSGSQMFVMRVQFLNGQFDTAKVLLTSTASEPGSDQTRGIAVSANGLALTTLPMPQNGIPSNGIDEPIGFGIDFDEGQGSAPFVAAARHVDSREITLDGSGNFVVATGAAGSAFGQSSQTIVIADSALSQFHGVPVPVSSSTPNPDTRAVGLSPDGRWFYVAFTDLGQVWRMSTAGESVPIDFLGDGKTDVGVFRPPTAEWFIRGGPSAQFGAAGDWPVPADYNGDGVTDFAVYRPATAQWFIAKVGIMQFGTTGDIPVPADYDGDGKADLAVYRPSTGQWFIMGSASGGRVVPFGTTGDIPVPADYDGDGKTDLAVYRPSTGQWFMIGTTSGRSGVQFGAAGVDVPVPADYDGDGKADLAVYRPTTAVWYLQGKGALQFGWAGVDVPVPADYTGAGKANLVVYRPPTGQWFFAGVGVIQFGAAMVDIPLTLPLAYRVGVPGGSSGSRTASGSSGGATGGTRDALVAGVDLAGAAAMPPVVALPPSDEPPTLLQRTSRRPSVQSLA